MIGDRIRLARTAARMSLRELAQRIGVSYEAVRKYERGLLMPSSDILLKLAHALNKPVDFFRPLSVSVGAIQPAYRGHARCLKRNKAVIEAHIRDWLERYLTVEQILGKLTRYEYPPGFPRTVHTLEEVEQAAVDLRRAWELGLAPIANLTETMEERGVFVGEIPACDGFDACAFFIQDDETLPVIVFGDSAPGDRQRFSLAHELGHIMLRTTEGLSEEAVAKRFAGAFLAPEPVVKAQPRAAFFVLIWLYDLKHLYGMSMQAWIRRAYDLRLISRSEYERWNRFLRSRHWNRQEPGEQVPREHPNRFRRLVFEAYGRELITASRGSQLLGISLQEFLNQYAQLQGDEPAHALSSGQ